MFEEVTIWANSIIWSGELGPKLIFIPPKSVCHKILTWIILFGLLLFYVYFLCINETYGENLVVKTAWIRISLWIVYRDSHHWILTQNWKIYIQKYHSIALAFFYTIDYRPSIFMHELSCWIAETIESNYLVLIKWYHRRP